MLIIMLDVQRRVTQKNPRRRQFVNPSTRIGSSATSQNMKFELKFAPIQSE